MTNTSTDEPTGGYPPVAQSNVTVRFRGDAERLQSMLLPPPLDPVGDGDIGLAAVVDTIRLGGPESPTPETGVYEAALGMPCRFEGTRYTVYPLVFVDRQCTAFDEGYARGVANVAKTKWHRGCRNRREIQPGNSVAGTASHRGEMVFNLSMEIEEPATATDLHEGFFDFVRYRHLPDPLATGDGTLANNLVATTFRSFTTGSIWSGPGTLSFGTWKDGLLKGFVKEVLGGYHITMGHENDGNRVLAAVDSTWGEHIE